jgi:hypothetical protein
MRVVHKFNVKLCSIAYSLLDETASIAIPNVATVKALNQFLSWVCVWHGFVHTAKYQQTLQDYMTPYMSNKL